MKFIKFGFWIVVLVLAACGTGRATEAVIPTDTPAPVITSQPTRTPLPSPTPLPPINSAPATALLPATSILPATVSSNTSQSVGGSITRLLQNGRGLSTGSPMSNGNFEVEGYCPLLNQEYGVSENDVDWFCTFNDQRALTLRENHFTDICRRTYNNLNAFAQLIESNQDLNHRWRCFEYTITPTPTVVRVPQLLQNGIGLSTGSPMNDGNFEVEAYCTAINPTFGVDEDGNFWYCTQNGRNVMTLGVAEFDDICFRTYRVPGAFAQQESNPVPAYGWRCYAYFD